MRVFWFKCTFYRQNGTFLHRKKTLCLQKKTLDQNHPLCIGPNKKHHAERSSFSDFSAQSSQTNSKGMFWCECAFYRQNGKAYLFYTKKLYAYKRRVWTKTTTFGSVRIKIITPKGADFKIFQHSYFLQLSPPGGG